MTIPFRRPSVPWQRGRTPRVCDEGDGSYICGYTATDHGTTLELWTGGAQWTAIVWAVILLPWHAVTFLPLQIGHPQISSRAFMLLCYHLEQTVKETSNLRGIWVVYTWVRTRRGDCLVTWFCYQMIAKPGNKTVAPSWPDPHKVLFCFTLLWLCLLA